MLILYEVFLFVITLINSLAHSTGFLLLKELYRSGKDTPQLLYIMNLSICETVKNLVLFILVLLRLISRYGQLSPFVGTVIMRIQVHLVLFGTMIFVTFYVLMIFVTIDRLLEVYLHIRYSLFVNISTATRQLKATWVLCVLVSIYLSIQCEMLSCKSMSKYDLYVFLALDWLYLIIAVITYTYLFMKFKSTRGDTTTNQLTSKNQISTLKIFRHSRFYVPVLLVTIFLFLFVIPDLIASSVNFNQNRSKELLITLFICNAISDFCDAVVYIFIQRPVRQLFVKKCHYFWHQGRENFVKNRNPLISARICKQGETKEQLSIQIADTIAESS